MWKLLKLYLLPRNVSITNQCRYNQQFPTVESCQVAAAVLSIGAFTPVKSICLPDDVTKEEANKILEAAGEAKEKREEKIQEEKLKQAKDKEIHV